MTDVTDPTDVTDGTPMTDYSHDELMACFVSRSVPDNVSTFVGAALPALRAGVLLGHLMHAPSTRMLISMTTTNLHDVGEIGDFAFMTDWRAGRWAEHYRRVEDIFSEMTRIAKWEGFYVGALQVDPYGNSNLLGIPDGSGGWKLRGPGSIGTPSVTAVAKSFGLVVNRHDQRTFVPECDLVSCPGWIDGAPGARERLGLRGGPQHVLTPLGVLGFGPDRRLRIEQVNPRSSVAEIQEQTGFDIEAADEVTEMAGPTEEELEVLRTRIDVGGVLRRERRGHG
jgi:glutaconate CoA-transferase, subunit B